MLNETASFKVDANSLALANSIFGDADMGEVKAPVVNGNASAFSTEGKTFGYADETGFFWGDSDVYRRSPGFIPGYFDGFTFTPSGEVLTIDTIEVDKSNLIQSVDELAQYGQSVTGLESLQLAGSIFGEDFGDGQTSEVGATSGDASEAENVLSPVDLKPEVTEVTPQRHILTLKKKVENSGE